MYSFIEHLKLLCYVRLSAKQWTHSNDPTDMDPPPVDPLWTLLMGDTGINKHTQR